MRKIYYNITTTGLSVAVALVIGSIELLQVMINVLDLKGPFYAYVQGLDFGVLGYVIVAIFLISWGVSVGIWKWYRIEERYGTESHTHTHVHAEAENKKLEHRHKHFE